MHNSNLGTLQPTIDDGPPNPESSETLLLPRPGQALNEDNRQVELVHLVITKATTKAILKGELAKYGLPRHGKRDDLIERLREFAKQRGQWAGPAVQRKRGDISTSRSLSHSAKRIIAQFGTREPIIEYQNKHTGDNRTPQPLPDAVVAANDTWAQSALTSYPIRPVLRSPSIQLSPATVGSASSEHEESNGMGHSGADVAAGSIESVSQMPDHIRIRLRRMERELGQVGQQQDNVLLSVNSLHAKIDGILNPTHSTVSPPYIPDPSDVYRARYASIAGRADNQNIPRQVHTTTCVDKHTQDTESTQSALQLASDLEPQHELPVTSSMLETVPATVTGCLCVSLDGHDFYFRRTDLPLNPPALHFSNDISALFREWHVSSLLVISGRGIPIKHWDKFYKKRGRGGVAITDIWESIKTEWGNWKFLAEERDRFPTEAAFWDVYCDNNGSHMSYQQILDALQTTRVSMNEADYNAAVQYFSGDLGRADTQGIFKYRKRNKSYIMTNKRAIAEKWRELLDRDPATQAGWAAMQSEGSLGSMAK